MENKQTTIEWLQDQFRAFGTITDSGDERTHQLIKSAIDMCEKAKAMEKEQIIDAWNGGDYAYFYSKETGRDFADGTEYYNETYGK